ncbi:DNA topoisomerase [Mrakia frigida]|uniref:DNA topoisomerase n=1 Tax=Mrakia frigida TaxID=29902 RepID=UPI003FCC1D39
MVGRKRKRREMGLWSRSDGTAATGSLCGRRLLHSSLRPFAIVPHPKRVLCVAEKPSIAKEIARILGNGKAKIAETGNKYIRNYTFNYSLSDTSPPVHFTVTSVLGHLTQHDFPATFGWNKCPPIRLFDAEISKDLGKGMKFVASNIRKEAKDHDLLLIWTDCDREGEHIGEEIVSYCKKRNPKINVLRSRFDAIIPDQIHQAAQNPVQLDLDAVAAVEARIELDLRTGASITRLLTGSVSPLLSKWQVVSYGSCQFPTLGFVVYRYLKIQSFVSEDFWTLSVSHTKDGVVSNLESRKERLSDLKTAEDLLSKLKERPEAVVTQITTEDTEKKKPLPLTTVSLQKEASKLLHLSPKEILGHASKLYQRGLLSYPRTESDQYDAAFNFSPLIKLQSVDGEYGALLDGEFERPRDGKKNDKAHPPIHPTSRARLDPGDEKDVYDFVVRRFLASCSRDAKGARTTLEIKIADEEFRTSGLIVHATNYLDLKKGSTAPPQLLSEADLVGLMDDHGIGTDATIADHIAAVMDRHYVVVQEDGKTKRLKPSQLGIALVEAFDEIGEGESAICRPELRRETEQQMKMICEGKLEKSSMVASALEKYKAVFLNTEANMAVVRKHVRERVGEKGNPLGDLPIKKAASRAKAKRKASTWTTEKTAPSTSTVKKTPTIKISPSKAAKTALSSSKAPATSSPPPTSTPQCGCISDAIKRTVGKPGPNKGRKFWACRRGEGNSCGFFQWSD